MKEVAKSEYTPTAVDKEHGRRFEKDVSDSGIGVGPEDDCATEAAVSMASNRNMMKKTKKMKLKKKKKCSSSSDSEDEDFVCPQASRSFTQRANGYSARSVGSGGRAIGTGIRRLTKMGTPVCKWEENGRTEAGANISQKTSKSGSARARAGLFSCSEDDIDTTVKKIKLQSSKRSLVPDTAAITKKIKPDPDAAKCATITRKIKPDPERVYQRVSRSPRSCVSRSRKLIISSDESDIEKEDLGMMSASPFSGISHEGKPLDGFCSKLVVPGGDKPSTPLPKLNPSGDACGRQPPSRLLKHSIEKLLPEKKGLKPNGIVVASRDSGETLASQRSPREGPASHDKPSPPRASHDSCSKLSGPKKRGRPKMNTDKEVARVTTERSRECSTSKPACPNKGNPGAKGKIITEKQKLRNKVKDLLLSSGWTIELHPRRGRNYEDSVYVSPEGSGYWSITKAYAVYQRTMKIEGTEDNGDMDADKVTEDNRTDQSHPASKSSVSELPSFDLSILKRNVVNKRRSKEELALTRDHIPKKKGRKGVAKKSTGKRNGFIVPRNCSSHSAHDDHLTPGRKRKNKRVLVRDSSNESTLDTDNYIPYAGRRTILCWLIESGVVSIDANLKYTGKAQKEVPLEGQIKQEGIQCNCCSQIFTVSSFEIHAGSDLCKPFENIFVEGLGLSLLDCQVKAWQNQEESVRRGYYSVDIDDDPNDDTCGICGDGGELICCDSCPSTYHLVCLGMEMLPPGDWHCSYCSCVYCGAADCSITEKDEDRFHLLVCGLCERKYHQSCFPVDDSAVVDSSDIDSLFCGQSCSMIFIRLQKLLGMKNNLKDGFSWSLIQRVDDSIILEPPVKANCNAKIAVALAVMDECFLPILDHRSGVNLIQNVVYNFRSNFNRLNYSGFYTFILERDDEIVAAASLRIHGRLLAEMPFIGTRSMYRRQGMCRRLLTAIETTLSSLGIERLLIPAISELEDTWTNVFNFRPLDDSFNQKVKSINMMVFPGTGLLEKQLLKHGKAEASSGASSIVVKEVVMDDSRMADRSVVSQDPENGLSIPPEANGFSVVDKKSFESAAPLCADAEISNDSLKTNIQKDSADLLQKEHNYNLTAPSNSVTDNTDNCLTLNCNAPEPFHSSNLPENPDVSFHLTEGCCDATSLVMPHGASSFENGGSVSLNGAHY